MGICYQLLFCCFFVESYKTLNEHEESCFVFGSTTGTCEEIAYKIAKQLNLSKSDVYNVTDLSADKVAEYEVLLPGTSNLGRYGELQDDWYDGIGSA